MSSVERFRKKPVVVEAMQWNNPGDHPKVERFLDTAEGVMRWTRQMADAFGPNFASEFYGIDTLEGTMRVSPGDWIIRGVQGEFYPCKPDIFAATYEPENAAALREQPEARGVVDAESLLDELESAAEDYSGRGLLWQGFRSRDERLAVVQAALTAAQQPVQEGGGEVIMPNLKASDPSYSHAERQWVFGYNAALADVMCLNRKTAPPSAPVEAKARAMFEAQADKLAAPWDRQWEPTKRYWREKAHQALTQQPAQAAPGCTCPSGDGSLRWPCPTHPPGDDAAGGGHG